MSDYKFKNRLKNKTVSECTAFELCDMPEEDELDVTESLSKLGHFLDKYPNFEEICMKPLEKLMLHIAVACGVDAYRKGVDLGEAETEELRRICEEMDIEMDIEMDNKDKRFNEWKDFEEQFKTNKTTH